MLLSRMIDRTASSGAKASRHIKGSTMTLALPVMQAASSEKFTGALG